jgi:hypothetical protein
METRNTHKTLNGNDVGINEDGIRNESLLILRVFNDALLTTVVIEG